MFLFLLQAPATSAPRPPPSRPLDSAVLRKGPITDATAHARVLLLARLEVWLQGHLGVGLEHLAFNNVPVLAMVLQEFVYDAFEKRWSIGKVRETLNGVAARYHWIRGQLSGPWKVVTTWAVKYPTTPHWPIPLFVLHALVYLAVGWDWHTVAALLLLGYYGLLRPGELIALRRQDILLMHENEVGAGYILVQILEPKTRFRRGRTHEYVKIEAPIEVLWFKQQQTAICQSATLIKSDALLSVGLASRVRGIESMLLWCYMFDSDDECMDSMGEIGKEHNNSIAEARRMEQAMSRRPLSTS